MPRQLLLAGDSGTAGKNGGFDYANGGTGCWAELVRDKLAKISGFGPLISSGIRLTQTEATGLSSGEWSGTLISSGTAVVSTNAWDRYPYGQGSYGSGSSITATYTVPAWVPPIVGFQLYWIDLSNGSTIVGGNWSYQKNSGAWTAMGQTLAHDNSLNAFYINTPLVAGDTITIRCADASGAAVYCFPVGIELFFLPPTTLNGFVVHNIAIGGAQLHQLVTATSGDRLAIFDSVKAGTGSPLVPQPNTIIMEHIADVSIANTTTWNTDLTTFHTRVTPAASLGFINFYELNPPTYSPVTQASYRAQTKTTAAGFSSPVPVFDWYDQYTALGFIGVNIHDQANNSVGQTWISTLVAAASTGVQTGSLTGTQSIQVVSTAGFPPAGEFSINGLSGNDAKLTYSTIVNSTTFGGVTLVTGADFSLTGGDALSLTQNAMLVTAGLVRTDTQHETQAGHILISDWMFWWLRNNFYKSTLGKNLNPFTLAQSSVGGTNLLGGTTALAYLQPLADTVGITDSFAEHLTFGRPFTDTLGITETLGQKLVFSRALSDTVGITDSLARRLVFSRSLTDTVGIIDSIVARLAFSRPITNTVGITDSLARRLVFSRSLTDAVGIVDSLAKRLIFSRSIADATGITEALSQHSARQRNSSDTVGVTAAISNVGTRQVGLDNTVGISDILAAFDTYLQSIADTVGITDTLVNTFNSSAMFADIVGITDSALGRIRLRSTLADTTGITDTLARRITEGRTFTDSPGITDSINKRLAFNAQITDIFGLTDNFSAHSKHPTNFVDAVGTSDTIVRALHFILGLSDTVGIQESFSFTKNAPGSAALSDLVGITDSIATLTVIRRFFTNAVGITENFHTGRAQILNDIAGISAALAEHLTHNLTAQDQVGITEHLFSGGIHITLHDVTGISDTLTYVLSISHPGLVQPLKVTLMTNGTTTAILSNTGVTQVELQSSLLEASVIGG